MTKTKEEPLRGHVLPRAFGLDPDSTFQGRRVKKDLNNKRTSIFEMYLIT